MNNIKEFIEYAKQRSVESKGTNYEWDFNKLYPNQLPLPKGRGLLNEQ